MSETELNVLDLKKILDANDLYKKGMTLIEMQRVYFSFKCKQALEAEGLYETGMSDQDIKDIYNTLKKSEETATNDNEYREIMNRTNTNCSNIDMLIEESNATNENENDENLDVTSVQTPNSKHQTPSKSFSAANKKHSIKSINVLTDIKTNHPVLKLPEVKYSNGSIIYYHQKEILKLPLNERAEAISQYLLTLFIHHKNDYKVKWGTPIEPCQKKQFNGDLCVDFIPDLPDEDKEEIEDGFKPPENNDIPIIDNSYSSNRPKRVVKRKNYVDQLTDDDDEITPIKKTKSSDDLNSNENSPESKWITKKKKNLATPKLPSYFSGNDRISKIFDKLKWDNNSTPKPEKKSAIQNLQDTLNLSDSDDEILPTKELVTTVNIHKEEDDQVFKSKNGKNMKGRKALSKKQRGNLNKLSIQKNSATKENESPEIPTSNFYSKNSDVDESNNNKLENSEELTNCPICNRPFHVSKIEVHASSCMQYEGKPLESFCDICHEYIPDKKFQSHKYECLKKITEESTIVDKPVTRKTRANANGFLCLVCDKYIFNTSEILHASNCIAKV